MSAGPQLRVAIAGAGFAAGMHLPGWRRLGDVEVVAIADPSVGAAGTRAREFGIPRVYVDVEQMLDVEKPDALDIAAPLDLHVPLCRLAASRGVHILCQKPVAPTLAEARSLAAELQGIVRVMVHENWRFRAHYRQAAEWIRAGAIGDVLSASMQMRTSGLLPRPDGVRPMLQRQPFLANLERFLVAEVLIHQLDVLRWLLGPLRVAAALTACSGAVRGEDRALITLAGDRLWAVLDASCVVPGAPPTPDDRLELQGTLGRILFENGELRLSGLRDERVAFDLQAGYADSYARAIAHFARALRSGEPFETDIAENLATLELVDRAYALAAPASHAVGRP